LHGLQLGRVWTVSIETTHEMPVTGLLDVRVFQAATIVRAIAT